MNGIHIALCQSKAEHGTELTNTIRASIISVELNGLILNLLLTKFRDTERLCTVSISLVD